VSTPPQEAPPPKAATNPWLKSCDKSPARGERILSFAPYGALMIFHTIRGSLCHMRWRAHPWLPPFAPSELARVIVQIRLLYSKKYAALGGTPAIFLEAHAVLMPKSSDTSCSTDCLYDVAAGIYAAGRGAIPEAAIRELNQTSHYLPRKGQTRSSIAMLSPNIRVLISCTSTPTPMP
jgi:hypothetical protein